MALEDQGVSEFDIARKRLKKTAGREAEQRKQSLQRRAAQLGGGTGRGTLLKAEQEAERQRGQQIAEGEEVIGAAERAEAQRKRDIKEQREFITSERLGSQEFAAGEAGLAREFSRAERLGSQEFSAGEAALGREAQAALQQAQIESNEAMAELDRQLTRDVEAGRISQQEADRELRRFEVTENIRLEGEKLDMTKDQFNQTFGLDQREFELNEKTVMFNRLLSAFEAKGGFVKWLQDSGVDMTGIFGEGFSIPGKGGGASALTSGGSASSVGQVREAGLQGLVPTGGIQSREYSDRQGNIYKLNDRGQVVRIR